VAFFIPIFEANIKHMAISSNDIKIRYVIDTTELSKAQQGFDKITAEEQDAIKELKKFNSELNKTSSNASGAGSKMSGAFKQAGGGIDGFMKNLGPVGPAIAGAFSIGAIVAFGKATLDVAGRFEKLGAILKNTLGSGSAAQGAMIRIQEIAATTPFSVEELTQSFVKLANQGFKPTNQQIIALGDLAASTGKSFDMLAEALIDAQVGEFERLKEFGVRASKAGDQVTFTFKNQETVVKNTSAEIQKYLVSLGSIEGVAGSMAAISATTEGAVSNLGDAWDGFLASIGNNLAPVFQKTLKITAEFLTNLKNLFQTEDGKIAENRGKSYNKYYEGFQKNSLQAVKNVEENSYRHLQIETAKLKELEKKNGETYAAINDAAMLAGNQAGMLKSKRDDTQIQAEVTKQKQKVADLTALNQAAHDSAMDKIDAEKAAQADKDKKDKENAAKNKKASEEALKRTKEQYQAQLKLAKMEQEQQTLILELQGAGKEAALAQEVIYQQKVAKIKEDFQKRGIGISEQEVAIAKLTAEKSVQEYEKAYDKLFLKPKSAIEKFQKDITKSEEEEEKKRYDNRLGQMKQWQQAYEEDLKNQIKKEEEAAKIKEEIKAKALQLGQEILNGGFDLYQRNLSNELTLLQRRYDEEIRLADGNQQKITQIEEKKREEEKDIKTKQFRANQLQAVANVLFSAAPEIIKYAVSAPPLAALVAALAATQTGFILAQPVPEFAEGTKGKAFEGGRAMVGERGVEKVVTASGKVYFTPPTATLVDLPKGSQVIPNHALSKQELFYASRYNGGSQASNPMYGKLDELGSILKGLPITQLNMDEKGFEKYIRTERRTTKILNNRFRS
jgi:hypothetical protein